jgi:hypothetical protein
MGLTTKKKSVPGFAPGWVTGLLWLDDTLFMLDGTVQTLMSNSV